MPGHRILLELTRRYTEPHRFYHGIGHIAWLFERARGLSLSEEQVVALWFHDAVYRIGSSTNEEESAALAGTLLAADGWTADRIAVVQRIVLDTKTHVPTVPESAPVIDLDLAPLAVPWDEFVDNAKKLRAEHEELGPADMRRRRQAFLAAFLARERLFWTDWGADCEPRARANLQRALDELQRDAP